MEPSDVFAVQVASLRKLYGKVVAVDDVSFEVERGSVFCIIGPNGAGKTTAIECLEGLRQSDCGSVLVAGLDPITDRSRLAHKIGVQLQEVGIPPRMKAREALRLFAALYRTSIPLSELSEELGFVGTLSKQYGSLSGGQNSPDWTWGLSRVRGQQCQKQPSTNTATFLRVNAMSRCTVLPSSRRTGRSFLNRSPLLWNNDLRATSGFVSKRRFRAHPLSRGRTCRCWVGKVYHFSPKGLYEITWR